MRSRSQITFNIIVCIMTIILALMIALGFANQGSPVRILSGVISAIQSFMLGIYLSQFSKE